MDLFTLADLPALTTGNRPKATITVARLDDNLRDPRYGKFGITQAHVDGWKRNLSDTFGGRVSIDFDHSSDRGGGTKAAAWITGLSQDGKLVKADVEFTPSGAKSVRDGDYLYISPTFVENFTDEHGQKHGHALLGAALTNRPVLRKGMPTLSLSRDSFDGVAVPHAGKHARSARKTARRELAKLRDRNHETLPDSRRRMADLADIAKLLGLPEDTDHVTLLAAVAKMKAPAGPSAPSGNAPAGPAPVAPKGTKKAKKNKKAKRMMSAGDDVGMTLSASDLADLVTAANAGQAAAHQLAEQTFDVAWTKALSEGRAAPSQEDTMRALYRKDSDIAIRTLDSFVRIVPVKPAGSGDGHAAGPAPLGMDDDRFNLHAQAKQLAEQRIRENPRLDPAETYALAAIELEERQYQLDNPGLLDTGF